MLSREIKMANDSIISSLLLSIFILSLTATATAQKKDRVEIAPTVFIEAARDCKDFKSGRVISIPKLVYPAEAVAARIGGTIRVTVKVDESGNVSEIEKFEGHQTLQNGISDIIKKARFSPTACDGAATPSTAVLTYNFIPVVSTGNYFTPAKIGELADIKNDSPYYEAILNLAENKLAFGYSDKKFYPNAPLTRGDFAQFLRLTLDLLSERAKSVNKLPREINLFYPSNPRKILSVNAVKDLKQNLPFYDSVKVLLLKYDIALINETNEFRGKLYLTNNEVIDLWSKIFGEEAIPVNFGRINNGDRLISRGEFALFLQESLQVLTYKVLP